MPITITIRRRINRRKKYLERLARLKARRLNARRREIEWGRKWAKVLTDRIKREREIEALRRIKWVARIKGILIRERIAARLTTKRHRDRRKARDDAWKARDDKRRQRWAIREAKRRERWKIANDRHRAALKRRRLRERFGAHGT